MTALPLSDEELATLLADIADFQSSATCTPWCWRPPGDGNGMRDYWTIGEQWEDDPPILQAVNWHEEENVKFITRLVNAFDAISRTATAYIAEREADRAKIKSMEGERDDAGTALYNEERRHDAAVRRANAAEANQRKPGTVEVCENHVYKECRNHGGAMRYEKCRVKPCPFNRTAEGGVT